MTDLVIRNGHVLANGRMAVADVAITDGRIVEVGTQLPGSTAAELDATGHLVLPGVCDAHVHFNDPGRAHWEGFATGSRALALGGGTSFIDMPLNASPPTIDRASFERKRAAGEAASVLDFALWGGLVPHNVDQLPELAECGVVGFKAFMVDSGIDDFPGVDPGTLRRGMKTAATLGLPVAVHAEDPARILPPGERRDARAFLDSRPIASEVEAVRVAVDIAGETGCALHLVHLSAAESLALVEAARAEGRDVTCEVCPHHLLLDEGALAVHGPFAKCAPPLRSREVVAAVWAELRAGRVDMIGSDHSPAPPEMKTGDDFFRMWGGIMGCQHGFLLLLDAFADDLPRLWPLVSERPAARFGLADRKGVIAPGADADLIVVSRGDPRPITAAELAYRHRTSPYVGCEIRSRVARSLLRGRDVLGPGPARGQYLPRTTP